MGPLMHVFFQDIDCWLHQTSINFLDSWLSYFPVNKSIKYLREIWTARISLTLIEDILKDCVKSLIKFLEKL